MTRLMLIFLCVTLLGQSVQAEQWQPLEDTIHSQLESLDLTELLDFRQLLNPEFQEYLPGLDWKEIRSGNYGLSSPLNLFAVLLRNLLRELFLSLHLLRQLVVVGVLGALLQRLSTSFGAKTVVDLALTACFLVLILIGMQSFQVVVSLATDTIDQMVSFMYSLIPLLSTLLVAVGGLVSSTVFHPLLWGLVGSIAGLVQYVILPLIFFGTAFGLVAHFSSEMSFSKLGGLFRQAVITLLGFSFLVFTGFMGVRGAIAPVTDGISLRTAKYLTKTFIPIAGGMFADTLEVVVGGSLLIKNGVGVFGLAMIALLVATPLLKVWAMVLIFKLVGALLEPICDPRLIQTLGTMESSLTLVFISLGTVALMFLVAISILVGIGNLTVFMR